MKDFIVNIVQQNRYVQRLKNVLYTWLLNFTFKKAEKLKSLKWKLMHFGCFVKHMVLYGEYSNSKEILGGQPNTVLSETPNTLKNPTVSQHSIRSTVSHRNNLVPDQIL